MSLARRLHKVEVNHTIHLFHGGSEPWLLPRTLKRRNELAYLALYYAITGNEERSEMIRRVVRRLEGQAPERAPELQSAQA